jgi:hypothetical protein
MFFFRKSTVDRSGWLEINEEDQPKLFELIKSISMEIETNFPQKVYLGAGVDAMVFYDSNFKNLLFPSKENLMIGLGLVNSMSESELKAILAHEFGHFTQRGLNVYSYIYIENLVIYKMLIDEEYYQSLILKFSTFAGRFGWIVIFYSRFIRWILRKTYELFQKVIWLYPEKWNSTLMKFPQKLLVRFQLQQLYCALVWLQILLIIYGNFIIAEFLKISNQKMFILNIIT